MSRTVILRNLRTRQECEGMFPGARAIAATMISDPFRTWVSNEVYVDEDAASPEVLEFARQRQASFANPILAVLPLWKIRAKFISAHEAMALLMEAKGGAA